MEKILKFLGDTFGNKEKGIQWGGVASLAIGTIGGFLVGDIAGAAIGLIGGTLLGGVVNRLIGDITGGASSNRGDRAPAGIDPRIQKDASETLDLVIDGKPFKLNLPKVAALRRPWGSENPDAFVQRMSEDTLRIIQNPEKNEQSVDHLLKTVEERNQPFYNYLATVQKYHTDFEKYNAEVRPGMMRQLGLTDRDIVFAPPTYNNKLELKITEEEKLGLDTRVHLGISEQDWNRLDAVTKLSRIEESMNKRMIEVSRKQADLKAAMEAQSRKVPFDLDFSGNAFANRLNWATFEIFDKTAETRVNEAMKDFYEGKKEHQHKLGDRVVIVRDEKAAEDEFRNKMDAVINEFAARGHSGGDVTAAQLREMVSILIEERKVRIQWNGIKLTKQMWANEAERWTREAGEFRTELTTYAASYATGASANRNFAFVREFDMPLTGSDDARKEIDRLRREKAATLDTMHKAVDGVNFLMDKLNMNEDSPKSLHALLPVDIEKDIRSLPTWEDVQGRGAVEAPTEKNARMYYDAAQRLSRMLGAKVEVSVLRDAKGIPNFVIKTSLRDDKAVQLKDRLVAIRNAAGVTREQMGISLNHGEIAIHASSLLTIADRPNDPLLGRMDSEPTGVKDDIFRKLEAKAGDFQAAARGSQEDSFMRQPLQEAAEDYNRKLAAFKANNTDNRAIAALNVAHRRLAEATVTYLRTGETVSDATNKSRDENIDELARRSRTGTALEGKTGFRLFITDKRPGKTGKIVLDGVKQNGKYIVTGWARMGADEKIGEGHYFGKDILDTAQGVEFDPKTLKGMDELIRRIEPASREVTTGASAEVTTRPAAAAAPAPAAPAAAAPNILEQALASVSFKPLAEAADSYVLPILKGFIGKSSPAAAA